MKIDIVVATDKGYEQHTAVMLASLFANNAGNSFTIHILHSERSTELRRLTKFIKNHNQQYATYEIKEQLFSGFKLSHHISLATYFRLLIPDLLPKDVQKILYLDSDLVVLGDIVELWTTDISLYALAGRADYFERYDELGIAKEFEYFNAGVMLWNLRVIREINFIVDARDYLEKKFDQILYWDQDIINYLLQGRIKKIEKKWNVFLSDTTEDKKHPNIFHYVGSVKPWNYFHNNGFDNFYFRYLLQTPWFLKYFNRQYFFAFFLRERSYYKRNTELVKSRD